MSSIDFTKLRILIHDISPMMGCATKDLLHFIGVKNLLLVREEKEAISSLMLTPWDLLLTTWNPNIKSDNQLVTRVRMGDFDINRYTPVIVTSAAVTPQLLQDARDAGAHEVLGKPLTGNAVKEKIAAVISRPRSFVKADDFFGPDRRRRTNGYNGPDRRGEGDVRANG